MPEKVINYKSTYKTVVLGAEQILDTSETDGVKCVYSGFVAPNYIGNLKWVFDWKDSENQRIESISGYIILIERNEWFKTYRLEVDFDETDKTVTALVGSGCGCYIIEFELHLSVHSVPISLDELFAPSEINDVVLVVEGKKIPANKTFLSIHSEFFRALFSSNFKEGQLTEIPIEEVSYADFGLLMSTIIPVCTFPTDRNIVKLLELADRFIMPSVTHLVENHLLRVSQLPNIKKMWLADKYGMQKLLNHSIGQINGLEDTKKLKESPEYAGLSDRTKAMILDRL